jgi:hypothetical protein
MKKTLLLLSLSFLLLSNAKADLVIDNFDSKTIGQTLTMKAWYPADGTATVAADPANASNKAANIVTTNYDAMLKVTVTLPAGKTLADYTGLSFDMYIGTNANDATPNYKNLFVYLDDVKKHETTGYAKQAEMSTWTTKTVLLSSLSLTTVESAKNTFTIAFGISTDKGNYFVDNVKLTGGGDVTPPPTTGNVTIDFNAKTIGQTETMKAWYPADGTATIAADPTNASNKVVSIVTTNYDALLKVNVTLPAGKTLTNYETFSFDMYIGTNANDATPNYKNLFVYLDDVKKLETTGYAKQAEMSTWTTKTFTLASLALTSTELAKSTFALAFGMSTDKGNYFIDNVKLIEKATGLNQAKELNHNIFIAGNILYLDNKLAENILIYDLKGTLLISDQNKSVVDVTNLHKGLYIAKVQIGGNTFTNKIVK